MAGFNLTKLLCASTVLVSIAALPITASAQTGIASIYSGGRTADGEQARASGLTAAHRSLPFGTMVRVTNQSTGRSVAPRINDPAPIARGRIIDLPPAAARPIGLPGFAHLD